MDLVAKAILSGCKNPHHRKHRIVLRKQTKIVLRFLVIQNSGES